MKGDRSMNQYNKQVETSLKEVPTSIANNENEDQDQKTGLYAHAFYG